ncbi:MAG: ABC transporter ATP-binding protein [Albidovulum sp.]|nr:ABC transporter ATP-binding protein [Albidovulum sp.]MDE0307604.1 ABC transporter ATP-binding protein [Albidovulum sp.]MDE0531532.1 ABC transporter ATP-binding protein [Albidovulum sp.]
MGKSERIDAGTGEQVLEVIDLETRFFTLTGVINAVRGVTFSLGKNEILGIVGESGSGKSITCLSAMRLVPTPGRITGGKVLIDGQDIMLESEEDLCLNVRGKKISMVFQDPLTALNPTYTIGWQMKEALDLHSGRATKMDDVRSDLIDALKQMNMPDSEDLLTKFPHQLSGGMRQRVVIAIALLLKPAILIADEPTTALDVTVQAAVLDLIVRLRDDPGMSVIIVSHDLNLIVERCDRTVVMYGGLILESASSEKIVTRPRSPYTRALIHCIPPLTEDTAAFNAIPGDAVDLAQPPTGCPFHPRCANRGSGCDDSVPDLAEIEPGHLVRCFYPESVA